MKFLLHNIAFTNEEENSNELENCDGWGAFLFILLFFIVIDIVFRAIFDLSNKIALLILCRMYALYVKKKKDKN